MEEENQFQDGYSSSTLDVTPPEMQDDNTINHFAAINSVIPNRIFVGRIDYRVNLRDLRHVFSQHGAVREVKIVTDCTGLSKGYGFVTFESQEDVLKILNHAKGIYLRNKKLSIGQAIRKCPNSARHRSSFLAFPKPAGPQQLSWGSLRCSTPTGFPYTYQNEVAYYHCPNTSPPAHHWPPSTPLMLPQTHQPVYQPQAYHPFQYPWDAGQLLVPPSAGMYPQQYEYLYPPADGVSGQPPAPAMEDLSSEFVELSMQPFYAGVTPYVLQQDLEKNLFPS